MKGTERLLVLSLALCLVFCCANTVRIYGGDTNILEIFDLNKDITHKLLDLKNEKESLELYLEKKGLDCLDRRWQTMKLEDVNTHIARIEATCRVSYQDYLKMQAQKKGYYEKEMENLRTKLEKAKEMKIKEDIQRYQKELNALVEEGERIKKLYNEQVQFHKKIEEEMKQERAQHGKMMEDMKQIFNAAKNQHSRVLEVMSATSNEGFKPAHVPQLEAINKLKEDIKKFILTKDKKIQINGLKLTKTKLEALLPELHEKSTFRKPTDRSDMEEALSVMETNTAQLREKQNSEWKELVKTLKKKGLTDVSDADIASLEKINDELKTTDHFAQEVAQRSAYLKALLYVYDLSKECSDAIRDSENGILAKLLAFAH